MAQPPTPNLTTSLSPVFVSKTRKETSQYKYCKHENSTWLISFFVTRKKYFLTLRPAETLNVVFLRKIHFFFFSSPANKYYYLLGVGLTRFTHAQHFWRFHLQKYVTERKLNWIENIKWTACCWATVKCMGVSYIRPAHTPSQAFLLSQFIISPSLCYTFLIFF